MSEFIVTIGPPGSGKSTWAERNLPPNCLRLERDRMREAFWPSRDAYHRDPLQNKSFIIGSAMFQAAKNWPLDRPIAMTDTGVVWDLVKRFWPLRRRHRLIIFDVDPEILRERNRTRNPAHQLQPDILEDYITAFQKGPKWWENINCKKEYVK